MPLYGIKQAGWNLTDLSKNLTALAPGDGLTLFDGTETPAVGVASVAYARGYNPGGGQAVSTFSAVSIPAGMTIDIQGANDDADANYTTIGQMTGAGNVALSDTGSMNFYRLKLSAYASGAMPVCKVQR